MVSNEKKHVLQLKIMPTKEISIHQKQKIPPFDNEKENTIR